MPTPDAAEVERMRDNAREVDAWCDRGWGLNADGVATLACDVLTLVNALIAERAAYAELRAAAACQVALNRFVNSSDLEYPLEVALADLGRLGIDQGGFDKDGFDRIENRLAAALAALEPEGSPTPCPPSR